MVSATRRLVIDPNASYGGRVSTNEPLSNLEEDYNQGRIRAKPGAAEFPTLQERLSGRGESTIGQGIGIRPSISTTPNIAPFPLGCPQGFYQQGDVCIPSVDLIPGEDKFPRVAGKVFPRGVIQDVIPPEYTRQGEFFYVQCIIVNDGSAEGKFFFRVTIPSLNVDTETEAVRVPPFEEALLYKRVRMPEHAASIDDIAAEVTISHFNQEEQHITDETKIVDDTTETLIPGPTGGYTTADDAQEGGGYSGGGDRTPECFTMTLSRLYDISGTYDGIEFNDIDAIVSELNGRGLSLNNTAIEWCPTGDNSDLAVIIEGVPHTPTNMTSENDTRNAAITLTPHNAIRDGDPVTVVGMNFAPHETIDIVLRMTTSAIDDNDDAAIEQYEGKVFTKNTTINADSGGDFRTTIRSHTMPSGIVGDAVITATGIRSSKTAAKSIQVT